ncbi:22875_t:CDS:2, partial [Gigaspora margarita]
IAGSYGTWILKFLRQFYTPSDACPRMTEAVVRRLTPRIPPGPPRATDPEDADLTAAPPAGPFHVPLATCRGENFIGAKVSTPAWEGSLHKGTKPSGKGAPFLQGFQDISGDALACGQKGGIDSSLQCPQEILLDFGLCLRQKDTVDDNVVLSVLVPLFSLLAKDSFLMPGIRPSLGQASDGNHAAILGDMFTVTS